MLPAKKPTIEVNGISKPNDAASSENRSQSRPMISRPVAGSMNRFGNGLVSQSNQVDSPSGPLRNGGNNSWKACLFIVCAPWYEFYARRFAQAMFPADRRTATDGRGFIGEPPDGRRAASRATAS